MGSTGGGAIEKGRKKIRVGQNLVYKFIFSSYEIILRKKNWPEKMIFVTLTNWLKCFIGMLIYYSFHDLELKSVISEGLRLSNFALPLVCLLKTSIIRIFLSCIYSPYNLSYHSLWQRCYFLLFEEKKRQLLLFDHVRKLNQMNNVYLQWCV